MILAKRPDNTLAAFYTQMARVFQGLLANIVELKSGISVSNHFTAVLQPQLLLNLFIISHQL